MPNTEYKHLQKLHDQNLSLMLKFIVSLFEPIEEELKVLEPRPLRLKLKTNDPFGSTLENYNQNLPTPKRHVANKLLIELMKVGSTSRPVKDWAWLRSFITTSFSIQNLYDLNAHWWSILQQQAQSPSATYRLEPAFQPKTKLAKANISAARGILWLNIYLLKAKSVPNVLRFVSACQDNHLNCAETSMKLALAGIDMLAQKPYFRSWRREITYSYPNLLRGRIAKRLEMVWARKAS